MSELKCPFCQQELDSDNQGWEYGCSNPDCKTAGTMCGTEELWQELMRTRKALDLALDALTTIGGYSDYNDCVGVALDAKDEIYEVLEQKGE